MGARKGNKFGWHSGVLTAKDAKLLGDLYVQDDIVFSDVSAGTLGVTGGIDMQSTTSAIGIDMGGTFSTSAINIDGTCTNRALMIGTKNTGLKISSGAALDAEPANNYLFGLFSAVQTTEATSTDELRSAWIRTRVNVNCDIGSNAGWGYGVCGAEIQLKFYGGTTSVYAWQNSALWAQLESQAATTTFQSGSYTQCVLANIGLTSATLATGAVIAGVTINANTATLTNTGNAYYGLFITDKNTTSTDFTSGVFVADSVATTGVTIGLCTTGLSIPGATTTGLSVTDATTGMLLTFANSKTEGISMTVATSKTVGVGMSMSGAGIWTTGILLDATGIMTDGMLISATTPVDGIHISSACSANAINLSGANLVGIGMGSSTTGINFTGTYTTGINFAKGANGNPIVIGTKANTADQGLILTGVTDDTGGVMVFCDDGGDALSSITSPIWTRYLITTNQGTGGPTATGLYAQTKNLAATFATGSYTALKAFYQVGGATVLNGTATELSIINAGISFEGNLTVTNGTCSGVDININDGAFTIGTHSGLLVRKTSGSTLGWTTGITIADMGASTGIAIGTTINGMTIAACTTGISITTVTTGISITGTGATASAKALSTAGFTLNNGNLTDGYGIVECDLTVTGTVAGMVAPLSSWVNMASVTTGANYICAQQNGLWSDTGGVLTNGVFIFGMRADCLLQTNGGVGGAKFYPFSVVNNTNITTALFKCNAGSSDVGTTAVSKTTESKYVPLYEDDAGVHYVLIYN